MKLIDRWRKIDSQERTMVVKKFVIVIVYLFLAHALLMHGSEGKLGAADLSLKMTDSMLIDYPLLHEYTVWGSLFSSFVFLYLVNLPFYVCTANLLVSQDLYNSFP